MKKETDSYKHWIYGGIAFALGNVMRPIGIIWLAAIGIWVMVDLLTSTKRKKKWLNLRRFGVCVFVYLGVFYGLSQLFIGIGVTDTGLKNNNPYWKFVVGLNEDTKGVYSFEDVKMLKDQPLSEELFNKEKSLIRERLSIPPYRMAKLMIGKVASMWGNYELGVFTFPHMLGKNIKRLEHDFDILHQKMLSYEKMMYLMMIALVIYGLMMAYMRDDTSKYRIIYYMLTMYTGIHLLIEVSPRYKYGVMGMVFILAGNGIRYLYARRVR